MCASPHREPQITVFHSWDKFKLWYVHSWDKSNLKYDKTLGDSEKQCYDIHRTTVLLIGIVVYTEVTLK